MFILIVDPKSWNNSPSDWNIEVKGNGMALELILKETE